MASIEPAIPAEDENSGPLDLGDAVSKLKSVGSVYDYICIDDSSNRLVTRITGRGTLRPALDFRTVPDET
jgi:hypothetical protein